MSVSRTASPALSCPRLRILRKPPARAVSCPTRCPITLLPYLPESAFPATRYAAVTPDPYVRRPRATAGPLGPAPGRLGRAKDPQPRLPQVVTPLQRAAWPRPSELERPEDTPSATRFSRQAWPAVPRRPLQERGKTATFARKGCFVFLCSCRIS